MSRKNGKFKTRDYDFRVKARRYDEKTGRYHYDIRFKTRAVLSERTVKVAEAFGLGVDEEKEHVVYRDFELKLADGDIVYVTGDSGSGKSALLRALAEDLGDGAVNIGDVKVDHDEPMIEAIGGTFQEALSLLSRVGLNDAFLFLRRYPELSDGQKYRYRIARMIDSGKRYWLADEFCSTLDRTTARIVAFNIQKMARRSGATLIAATTHTDLEEDLSPSVLIRKGWGDEIEVEYRPNAEARVCTVAKGVAIREGSREDYRRLSHLHYRESRAPIPIRFYAMEDGGELVGVVAYSYPLVSNAGRRRAVGYSPRIGELNRDWATISRVIIHPKYRTTGLGARLVRETLPMVGRRHVELIAVMAQYNPFAEQAGMKRVAETRPHPSVWVAVERLRRIGFDPVMMSSRAYSSRVLGSLGEGEVGEVREALLCVGGGYYRRLMRSGSPYVGRREFGGWLLGQSVGGLAECVRTLSILSGTKVYLYWCRDWLGGV